MLAFTNNNKYKSIGIGQNTTKFVRPILIPDKKADTTDTIDASLDETVMHVVVECDKYDVEHKRFLNLLRNECEEDRIVEWMEIEVIRAMFLSHYFFIISFL